VAICARATTTEPTGRLATARDLHDAVEAYLEGDRDLEQRRRAAADHVRRADEVLAPARGRPTAEQSARAVQELGRALALDPENGEAMSSLMRLLSAPPIDLPADVRSTSRRPRRA
jgi:serine/threonine-protein kinase